MQAFEMKLFIYAETEQEVEECRKAVHAFIEENRKERACSYYKQTYHRIRTMEVQYVCKGRNY